MTDALTVTGLSKRFGDVAAVDDVSFTLGADELLALVGPSGCGKSTMLRVVAGLHRSDAGSIVLGGVVVDDADVAVPPERRRVGLVFQEHVLFPHLTAAGNIAFGVGKGRDADARVVEMLDVVGLAGFGDRYPHELSGGERQRVALARALAPRPALMLLDEPFASLDPNLRARVRDDVVGILRSSGTPAIVVTHDQPEALAIGDRIAVMREGRVVQLDRPERVFHEPADRFVAAFMGEADFLTAGAARRDLCADVPSSVATDALVMVRPDDVAIAESPDGDARVTDAEFRGTHWCYLVRLPGGGEVHSIGSHLVRVPVGATVSATMTPGHRPVVIPAAG
jgi:iron(III) transport system ATP-binding protein